jgi:hypothetical protein
VNVPLWGTVEPSGATHGLVTVQTASLPGRVDHTPLLQVEVMETDEHGVGESTVAAVYEVHELPLVVRGQPPVAAQEFEEPPPPDPPLPPELPPDEVDDPQDVVRMVPSIIPALPNESTHHDFDGLDLNGTETV